MCPRIRKIRLLRRFRRRLASVGHNERGVQLVELAIVLPLFMILFAATAEFGRYFYEYTTLAKATRAGTRYLITAQVNGAEDTTAKNIVVYGNPTGTGSPILTGLDPTNIVITRTGGTSILPQLVKMEVTGYKHQPIFDLGLMTKTAGLSLNIDVKPSVTMRYLLTQPPPIP